jgi:hypothetical protein
MSSKDPSKYQQGIIKRYYDHKDTLALQKLSEVVSDLYIAEGGQSRKLWESARAALAKLAPDDPEAADVLSRRDVNELARLVSKLSAAVRRGESETNDADGPVVGDQPMKRPQPQPVAPTPSNSALQPDAPAHEPTSDELKRAMKAFRKRLKLKRLDDESKLGRSPLTSGKASRTVAIMAPREYPQAIWDELVKQGKLKRSGAFYELVD